MATPRKKPEDFLPMGRPTKYTEDLAKLICSRVATNPVGLETLVTLYDDMPEHSTIKAWRHKYPNFSAWYLEAKSLQAQLLVEEIDEMIPNELLYLLDKEGQKRIDPPSASLVIAKINNRKWQAARLAPKVYGNNLNDDDKTLLNDTVQKVQNIVNDLTAKTIVDIKE